MHLLISHISKLQIMTVTYSPLRICKVTVLHIIDFDTYIHLNSANFSFAHVVIQLMVNNICQSTQQISDERFETLS